MMRISSCKVGRQKHMQMSANCANDHDDVGHLFFTCLFADCHRNVFKLQHFGFLWLETNCEVLFAGTIGTVRLHFPLGVFLLQVIWKLESCPADAWCDFHSSLCR
ncbi:unnamed protein product [Musa banksii]